MASLILYPAVGIVVLDEDGNVIPEQGVGPVAVTPYYQNLLTQGLLLRADPLASGLQPVLPPGPRANWFTARSVSADTTASSMELVQVTAPSAATTVVTAPAGSADRYFGVQFCGQALGKSVEVRKADATLIATLNVDDEVAWLAYDAVGAAWRVASRTTPSPIYDARFSPLGCWLSTGADANISDLSGNGRSLTKVGTIAPAVGAEQLRLSTSYAGRYTSADAAFSVGGALSIEYFGYVMSATSGNLVQCGSGTGGSANNYQYLLGLDAPGDGTLRMSYSIQNATNSTQTIQGPYVELGWNHFIVTRPAASPNQAVKFYMRGALGQTTSSPAPTGGGSATLAMGGVAPNNARANFQMGSIWNTELTAAQVAYLAQLRLGKGRR